MPRAISYKSAAFLMAYGLSAAVGDLSPSSDGCVDPSGFDSCYQDSQDASTACVENIPNLCGIDADGSCAMACANVQKATNLACFMQSCWNELYGCSYQLAAIDYLATSDQIQGTVDIPFYPAPEGAPGACVCNLGDAWGNMTVVPLETDPCTAVSSDGDVQATTDCNCCWVSGMVSDVYNVCPNNDLSVIGFDQTLNDFLSANQLSSDNCAILEDSPAQCSNTYDVDIYGSTWINPGALPTEFPGSAPLSDLEGSLTTLTFDIYTLELFPAYTTIITPAPYDGKNVDQSTTAAATTSAKSGGATQPAKTTASVTGTSAGTHPSGTPATSSAGAAQTSKNSAVKPFGMARGLMGGVAVVAIALMV